MSQKLAIANCRVSSTEQLENNSLNRQEQAVLKAANELEVTIPENYWWRGSVSSKRGTNINRKDINEMIESCKKDRRIKYLIVDEPDRFMRSIDEAAYFEVTFRQLGVTVWYASDPELNKGDLSSKLLKFTKYLSAEGSNEERQRKSISGQTLALKEGRYPFVPKPGYKRGYERGIPEIDETRAPSLKQIMLQIIDRKITPSQGLVEINKTDFVAGRAKYKMDKFRNILIDPFYAGIVEVKKQVNVRNENGLHKPLLTKEQHLELVKIMEGKPKNQNGPRKNGNPKYPLSNIVDHEPCKEKRYGRIVGLDLNNGTNKNKIYEKYRCRACRRSVPKDELHLKILKHMKLVKISEKAMKDLTSALKNVWATNESQREKDIFRIKFKINKTYKDITNQVEAATNPENAFIKAEIMKAIETKKIEISKMDSELYELEQEGNFNKSKFIQFAYDYINELNDHFLQVDTSQDLRKMCKQLLFPAGILLDAENNVYTPEISPLIRLERIKKDLIQVEDSIMVRVRRL